MSVRYRARRKLREARLLARAIRDAWAAYRIIRRYYGWARFERIEDIARRSRKRGPRL